MKKLSKKMKVLVIISSVVLLLAVIVGSFNIAYSVIGSKKQVGVSKGYEWNAQNEFSSDNIQTLDAGSDDFKILCLTDVHISNHGTAFAWLGINFILDGASKIMLNNLIKDQQPDLILITGDTVLTARNDIGIKKFADFIDGFDIPWAAIYGNHDDEGRADKAALCDIYSSEKYKNSLFKFGPADLHGAGNYVLNIKRGNDIVYSLYMMDSGSSLPEEQGGGYDGINAKQVEWYKWNVDGINKMAGKTVPSMAFYHIPIPEYEDAIKGPFEIGKTEEGCAESSFNSGFFDAFKVAGGTHMMVGHDHNNNFVADYQGVKLGYIQKSSYNCYFFSGMTGGTLITLKSDNQVTMALVG